MTNIRNFNKLRYIELFQKAETLRNQGTSLFTENFEEDLELLYYKIILENQMYYKRKNEYISLVAEYSRENNNEDVSVEIF